MGMFPPKLKGQSMKLKAEREKLKGQK